MKKLKKAMPAKIKKLKKNLQKLEFFNTFVDKVFCNIVSYNKYCK